MFQYYYIRGNVKIWRPAPDARAAYQGTQTDVSGNGLDITTTANMTYGLTDGGTGLVYMESVNTFGTAYRAGVNSAPTVTFCSWVYVPTSYGSGVGIVHNGSSNTSLAADTLSFVLTNTGNL